MPSGENDSWQPQLCLISSKAAIKARLVRWRSIIGLTSQKKPNIFLQIERRAGTADVASFAWLYEANAIPSNLGISGPAS
jgi:hypothetical protein